MNIGDRVRVKDTVVVYHNPENRGNETNIQGMEGEVVDIVKEWKGRPVSANFPIYVKFNKRFRAHLREDELEVVS